MISYCGAKSCLISTASDLVGRSRTWPIEALTTNSFPRYLPIVLAFAGDSTITNDSGNLDSSSLIRRGLRVKGRGCRRNHLNPIPYYTIPYTLFLAGLSRLA